jgi:hypothetical protein
VQRQQTQRVQRPQGREPAREQTREQGGRDELRVQRPPQRNRRVFAATLAGTGIALGVYALAPTSDADRLRTPRDGLRPPPMAAPEPAFAAAELPPQEPVAQAPLAAPVAAPVAAQITPVAAAPLPVAPAAEAKVLKFGESEVTNGRTFVLRMSGPVDELEGDQREDGFTVRVPGRLALDRASPIATSHRAVARAMILNRGDYAELTVDFLPGMRPKYQVIGRDTTIEVTLERQ